MFLPFCSVRSCGLTLCAIAYWWMMATMRPTVRADYFKLQKYTFFTTWQKIICILCSWCLIIRLFTVLPPSVVRLLSDCCPIVVRLLNGQQSDNNRTTNGQRTERTRSGEGETRVHPAGVFICRKKKYFAMSKNVRTFAEHFDCAEACQSAASQGVVTIFQCQTSMAGCTKQGAEPTLRTKNNGL